MPKNASIFEVKPAPDWFYCDSYYYRLLAHGHTCQCCKQSIIIYDTCEIAFKINCGPNNQQLFGQRILYNKNNWTVVCSKTCKQIIFDKYSSRLTQFELAKNIKASIGRASGAVKSLKKMRGDGYKEMVLRACGLDPSMYTAFKVYPVHERFDEITFIFQEIMRGGK